MDGAKIVSCKRTLDCKIMLGYSYLRYCKMLEDVRKFQYYELGEVRPLPGLDLGTF